MDQDTLLARWLAGELSETELKELEQSPEFLTLSRIKDNFETLRKPQFDSGKILAEVLSHEKKPTKVVPLYARRWFQVAAVAVLFIGLAITFFMPTYESAENGKTLAFHLPDNSEVVLNSASKADFSSWNWSSKRQVNLDGEAYFKVAKGKKFTVDTDLGQVMVVGTQFNVKSRGNRFQVVCFEGKVLVRFDAEEWLLTPGDGMNFEKGKQPQKMHIPDLSQPEWIRGEIALYLETLPEVVAEIERKYDVEIDLKGESRQLFTGFLPADNLDAALKAVCLTYHLQIEKSGNSIILKP